MTHHDIFARGMSENEAFPHFMVIGFGKFRNRMSSTVGEPHWTMESDVCSMAEPRSSAWLQVNCEHFRALQALVRRAASLGRHFQQVHGRRHGDFKDGMAMWVTWDLLILEKLANGVGI